MTLRFPVEAITGVIAIAPTPATPDATDFRNLNTVDLAETEKLVRAFVRDGVDGILTNGTFGEMSTLTFDEWKAYNAVVLDTLRAVKPDLPAFLGATTLNTRDTVARIKVLHDLGARGVFLGRPMWCELGPQAMLAFYQDVASEFPDVSFTLYDNPEAFKGSIPTEVLAELSKNPQFVAVKYGPLGEKYRTDVKAVGGRIRLMPLELFWAKTWEQDPDAAIASWSSIAPCGPEPIIYLRDALRRGDMDDARWISGRIMWSHQTHLAGTDFHEFAKYNIPVDKARFNAAGYINAGPARPPYHITPQEYIDGAIETGHRWKQVREEVRAKKQAA